jgi:DNA-binding NtrC family response regulator
MTRRPKDAEARAASGEEIATVAQRDMERLLVPMVRQLTVIEGPDTGKTFTLDPNTPSRILLGTSPACELLLTDPTVSRRHAAFEVVGRRCKVTDFASTNGTFVDGIGIVEAFVRGGEILRCGSTALRLDEEAAGEPSPLPSAMRFGRMVGASTAMRRLYPLCERLAASRVPVVIEGETGTGKENLAEALHEVGGGNGPFVVFDCTAVSPALVEAELFGHERGAFTGAVASRAGVFEQAHGGTLLIDEIGDLDLPLQAKLLRVIDRGELRRVGGQQQLRVDVRILAATRRDLDKEVAAGSFRDDLFHRLAVARVELPPLRDRHGDIEILTRHFVAAMGGKGAALSAETVARFATYSWPGNVRELRNAVARCIALGDDEIAQRGQRAKPASATPPSPSSASSSSNDWLDEIVRGKLPFVIARRKAVEAFEKRYVEHVLAEHGGNVTRAAAASGIALRYFHHVKARSVKT